MSEEAMSPPAGHRKLADRFPRQGLGAHAAPASQPLRLHPACRPPAAASLPLRCLYSLAAWTFVAAAPDAERPGACPALGMPFSNDAAGGDETFDPTLVRNVGISLNRCSLRRMYCLYLTMSHSIPVASTS